MSKYGELFTTETSQSQPIPQTVSTAKQEVNSAGGFVFSLDKFKRLERFLILGSDSNTYYSTAKKLTMENAACVNECWTEDFARTQRIIYTISVEGRAPKNDPAIFAIALGTIHANMNVRQAAFELVSKVCRTSTHLFQFVDTCRQLGKGWGRAMKTAVANWYVNKTDEQLAYQLIKYRQREGYTHERLIRLSHPKADVTSDARRNMYDWLRGRVDKITPELPRIIHAHLRASMMTGTTEFDEVGFLVSLVREFNLPWEALPTWANTKPEIWRAMLANGMPLTALIRNLGNMTRLGVFNDMNIGEATEAIRSPRLLEKARIHPFNLLNAYATYRSGKGFRGSNNWEPDDRISIALEEAFYNSFKVIEPSNKRTLLCLDVSGSMDSQMNNSNLTVREASSAMAMVTLAAEEYSGVIGFTSLQAHNQSRYGMRGQYLGSQSVSPLDIRRGMSLDRVVQYTSNLPFSGTDCSLPMLYAMDEGLEVDNFVIYTDSETWTGNIHPVEALRKYREKSGINAKLVVVGMTSTNFSIADPNDPGMLDVVGFDSNAPAIIADFCRDALPVETSHNGMLPHEQHQDDTSPISEGD